jgi:RNA polymerase sigma-70 factor (ECF subfamily)
MTDPEKKLIQNAQAGNVTAFERLVRAYDQRVLHLIYRMQGNLADAQDIYQETFLKAFEKIQTFRFESEFRTWLFRIAINQCVNARRKKRVRNWLTFNDEPDDSASVKLHAPDNPESRLADVELNQQIEAALNQLSAQQRSIFILKHYEGYKIKEISEMLHCAEGTVKNQIFRATRKLQNSLKAYLT